MIIQVCFLVMLKDEVLRLKKEKDVVILAHNYQVPEVQDVADFVGDSLGLSRQAAKVKQKTSYFVVYTLWQRLLQLSVLTKSFDS